jgi:hypothetical protein
VDADRKATLEDTMRTFLFAAALSLCATGVYAQGAACNVQASDKKLAGAGLTSFMKKGQSDAEKACEAESKEKKLAGEAKTSHTKKCVADAVGT